MNDHRERQKRLAGLPSVDSLLRTPAISALCERYPRSHIVAAVREVLRRARTVLMENRPEPVSPELSSPDTLVRAVVAQLAQPPILSFRPVINATGILFHDALGGATLSPVARDAITTACGPLLFDAPDGDGWGIATEQLLCRLTGAEAALVVNNAAAALWLAIDTLAHGKDVIISRGHLATIDGGFRVLDLIERCGAHPVEIGATNKTHLRDYRAAIRDTTGLVLAVRPSTYLLRGFVQEVPVDELVQISAAASVPVLYALGHATLTPVTHAGWRPVASVREVVQMGVAVVVLSGDGLVGGPECGIAVGRKAAIDRLRQNPLVRIVRPDKLTYAGLEATLRQIAPEASGLDHHPALWMISDSADHVAARAARLLGLCQSHLEGLGEFAITETIAYLTRSRLPSEAFPSHAITVRPAGLPATALADRLRHQTPAVLGTIAEDRLVLDLRAVADQEIGPMSQALEAALKNACVNLHPSIY